MAQTERTEVVKLLGFLVTNFACEVSRSFLNLMVEDSASQC